MKNILFILIACLMVTMVKAAPNAVPAAQSRRDAMIQLYSQNKISADLKEQFLNAAKNGDINMLNILGEKASNGKFFLATDKFGNNAFHLAKDVQTVHRIAFLIRQKGDNFTGILSTLLNQRNQFDETPLMAHINYGKVDTFWLLYRNSNLEDAVNAAKDVNQDGALKLAFEVKKKLALKEATGGGRTVAKAARANANMPGMDRVIAFFKQNAPYLF